MLVCKSRVGRLVRCEMVESARDRGTKLTGYASRQWTLSCVDGLPSEGYLASPHASFVRRDPSSFRRKQV
jgi:hypothetical protein